MGPDEEGMEGDGHEEGKLRRLLQRLLLLRLDGLGRILLRWMPLGIEGLVIEEGGFWIFAG